MLCPDLPEVDHFAPAGREGWYEDANSVAVAVHCLVTTYHEGVKFLEEMISIWLAEGPEHWPVLRLVPLNPWSDPVDHWHRDTPAWLRVLGRSTENAYEKFGPFGRQPATDGAGSVE